jgi:hypothetical protein
MVASRPAAGSAHAFFELFLGTTNAALARLLLLGILDPADELVASAGRDVQPRRQSSLVGKQCLPQVRGQLVHHTTGKPLAAHGTTLALRIIRSMERGRGRLVEASGMPRTEWSGSAATFAETLSRDVRDTMTAWNVHSSAVGLWLRLTRAQIPADREARIVLEFDESAGLLSFDAWVEEKRVFGADDWLG